MFGDENSGLHVSLVSTLPTEPPPYLQPLLLLFETRSLTEHRVHLSRELQGSPVSVSPMLGLKAQRAPPWVPRIRSMVYTPAQEAGALVLIFLYTGSFLVFFFFLIIYKSVWVRACPHRGQTCQLPGSGCTDQIIVSYPTPTPQDSSSACPCP